MYCIELIKVVVHNNRDMIDQCGKNIHVCIIECICIVLEETHSCHIYVYIRRTLYIYMTVYGVTQLSLVYVYIHIYTSKITVGSDVWAAMFFFKPLC